MFEGLSLLIFRSFWGFFVLDPDSMSIAFVSSCCHIMASPVLDGVFLWGYVGFWFQGLTTV